MPGLSAELEKLPGWNGGLFLVDQPVSAVLWMNLVVNDFAEIPSPSDLTVCKCLHLCDVMVVVVEVNAYVAVTVVAEAIGAETNPLKLSQTYFLSCEQQIYLYCGNKIVFTYVLKMQIWYLKTIILHSMTF